MIVFWWVLSILVVTFGFVVFRGAPYVPTHRKQVEQALDMLDVPKGSLLVDLGSGDGVFLVAAAKRGYRAVGYELNVIMWLISFIRCWRYRDRVSVRLRDFWLVPLPKDTRAVFVFLAGPYLKRLNDKLVQEAGSEGLTVISYGFEIPGKKDKSRTANALHLYHY